MRRVLSPPVVTLRRFASLGAALACAGLAGTARAGDDLSVRARAGVREVLLRPEFQPLADADRLGLRLPDIDRSWYRAVYETLLEIVATVGKPFAKLVGAILRWIVTALNGLFGGGTGSPSLPRVAPLIQWTLLCVAVAAIAFLVYRLVRSARAERRAAATALSVTTASVGEDDALARTPEDWRRRAERLAASGQRVEALRALYLELLAALHRVGAIDYDRTRTNTAYVRDLARDHAARPPFVSLTARFDEAVYGAHEPSATDVAEAAREVDLVRGAFLREAVDA